MLENRLFTVFPIYDSLADQNRKKIGMIDEIEDTRTSYLFCPNSRPLPFQFRQPSTASTLTSIKAVDVFSGVETDITARFVAGQIDYETAEGYTYVIHFGTEDLTSDMPCGTLYLKLTDGINTWYSEVFVSEEWNPALMPTPVFGQSSFNVNIIVSAGTNLIFRTNGN